MPDTSAAAVTARALARRRTWAAVLFVAGVLGLGANMRSAVTSLPPIFPELAGDLHLSPGALDVLAATPVLCFGVFSALAAPLSRRVGEERVLLGALVLLAGGLLLRGALPGLMLFPGTVLAAAAIAFLNVLLPSLVKRRRPDRAGWLIGTYLLCLSAGAILSSLIAVPVLQATGSVPVALGLWALPAIAAALLWLPQWRYRTLPPGSPPAGTESAPAGAESAPAGAAVPGRLKVSRYLLAWQVMGFMGLQSLTYYAALSWLPILLRDRGASAEGAGTLLGLMNFGNAVAALLIPVIAHRVRDQRALVAVIVAIATGGMLGVWLAPLAGALGWTMLLGLGQGAALGLAIYLMTARAPDPATAASLSGFAQGAGYLVATAGPLLIGLLHTATGGWTVPVLVLLAMFGGELVTGWSAARDKTLPQVPAATEARKW